MRYIRGQKQNKLIFEVSDLYHEEVYDKHCSALKFHECKWSRRLVTLILCNNTCTPRPV